MEVVAMAHGLARWLPRQPERVPLQMDGRSLERRWEVLPSKRQRERKRRESRLSSAIAKTPWCHGNPCRGNNSPGRGETRDRWKPARGKPECPAFGTESRHGEDPAPCMPS